MNLKNLSNEVLLSRTKIFVAKECEMILQVLHHLREIEEKIQDGKLTLSTVARAQNFFKKEDLEDASKRDIMQKLEGKSTRQIEKELLSLSSQPEVHLQEKVKPVTPTLSEVRFYADDELLEALERLKGLLAHSHPDMTTAQLVSYLAKLGLKELDPAQHKVRTRSTPAPNESPRKNKNNSDPIRSRYIQRSLVRAIWKRDHSRCTWTDPKTGRPCGSTFRLQIDHRHPFALGGKTELSNLRLLCAQHNRYEAEHFFPAPNNLHDHSFKSPRRIN